MPDVIRFAFIPMKYIEADQWKLQQLEVRLNVEGAEDPLTHQLMRDEVADLFKATQKKIDNDLHACEMLFRRPVKKQEKTKSFGDTVKRIQRSAGEFEKAAQAELDTFCRKEAEKSAKLEEAQRKESWSTVRWTMTTLWNVGKILSDTATLVGLSAGGPATLPEAVHAFYSLLGDIKSAWDDFSDSFANEEQMRTKVTENVKELKAGKKLTEQGVKALADNVASYETKVNLLELKTKALVQKLMKGLNSVPSGDGVSPKATKDAEETLDALIKEVTKSGQIVRKSQETLKKFKLNLGAARQMAKKSGNWTLMKEFGTTWLPSVMKLKDLVLEPGIGAGIDLLIGVFGDSKKVMTSS